MTNTNNQSQYPIHLSVGTKEFKVHELTLNGREIKTRAEIDSNQYDLFLEVDGPENYEAIEDDASVTLVDDMQFFVKHRQVQHVSIIIDGQQVSAPKHVMTGREILALVGRQTGFALYLIPTARGDERILDDQLVYLIKDEQFITMKNDITNGSTEVLLPSAEVAYLDAQGFTYEMHRNPENASEILLIVKNYDLGENYAPRQVDLLVKIPHGFPVTPMDMFWVSPSVIKSIGGTPNAVIVERILNRDWQRFSRHYTQGGWNPSMGGLRAHFTFILEALSKGE